MEQQQLDQLFAFSLTVSPHVQQSIASYVDYTDRLEHEPPSLATIWAALFVFIFVFTPVATYLFSVVHA